MLPLLMFGATCTSTMSGLWHNSSTWSCGHVPGCGDSIVIALGTTVTVSDQINMQNCSAPVKITVKGNLYFDTGKKMYLPCSSRMHIYPGGLLNSDGSGNSNLLDVCNTTYWTGSTFNGPGCLPPSTACLGAILPIELLSFDARECGLDVCITWKTATERNTSHYIIEKAYDGLSWIHVDRVQAAGNSMKQITYTTKDGRYNGITYYRLIQYDNDGRKEVFPIIALNSELDLPLLYPNPTTGMVNLSKQSNVKVYDSLGKLIHSSDTASLTLEKGVYTLIINERSNHKIIVIE